MGSLFYVFLYRDGFGLGNNKNSFRVLEGRRRDRWDKFVNHNKEGILVRGAAVVVCLPTPLLCVVSHNIRQRERVRKRVDVKGPERKKRTTCKPWRPSSDVATVGLGW